MHQFKDFDIPVQPKRFIGDKIRMKEVFDKKIKVFDYKIEPSTKKENTQRLTLQIKYKNEMRIIFTGSTGLMYQIQKIDRSNFPFKTTIINNNEYFEFT